MARIIEASNSATTDEIAGFVRRMEAVDQERESWRMKHVAEGRRFVEDRKAILDEAKERGCSTKALKAIVKARALERKAEACREELEDDDADAFDRIEQALGAFADSPLGAAALDKVRGKQDGRTAAIVDAVKNAASQPTAN